MMKWIDRNWLDIMAVIMFAFIVTIIIFWGA